MRGNNKKSNIYKGYIDSQSEFDHHYACWANNHNGWAKAKRKNKKVAKKRERRRNRDLDYEYYSW